MTITDAWHLWWSGHRLPDDALLCGIKLLWLGRCGLFVIFIGAVMVVFDALGAERVSSASVAVFSSASKLVFAKRVFGSFANFSMIWVAVSCLMVGLFYLQIHVPALKPVFVAVVYLGAVILSVNGLGLVAYAIGLLVALSSFLLSRPRSASFFRAASWLLNCTGGALVLIVS